MQKIGDTTKTADSNGEFTDGDPQKQIPCTWIMAAWLNTLQREVIKVVQEGGLTLNPKDDTQLYQAIEKLIGNSETDLKTKTLRQIRLPAGAATHWLKIASMPPAGNSEVRLEVELSGMSDYGINAVGMATDRVYMTTRGMPVDQRVTAATVGNLIKQFALANSLNASKYRVGVTEEVSNGTTTRYNFWLTMSDHTGVSSTMNLLNSTTNGVTITSDFSGANTTSTEPAGIVYAVRERFITTANPQTALQTKAADWTNNFAAKMGVSRVISGANQPTTPGVWSVENSTWAAVPWGSIICTTNGSDLSMATGSGKYQHYVQISHESGGKPGLRAAANVNGTFSGWYQALMSYGGTIDGSLTVNGTTNLDYLNASNGANIDGEINSWMTRSGNVGDYLNGGLVRSFLRGRGAYGDTRGAFVNLFIQEYVGSSNQAVLNLNGFGQDNSWLFRNDGAFISPGALLAGNAQVATDGNIWGTRWNANGQWLWDAINDLVNSHSPTQFRIGARTKSGWVNGSPDWSSQVPQGAVNIASLTEGDDRITSFYYAYPQYYINGNWVNFA